MGEKLFNVLFIRTGNSARSIFAERLIIGLGAGNFAVTARATIREAGCDRTDNGVGIRRNGGIRLYSRVYPRTRCVRHECSVRGYCKAGVRQCHGCL